MILLLAKPKLREISCQSAEQQTAPTSSTYHLRLKTTSTKSRQRLISHHKQLLPAMPYMEGEIPLGIPGICRHKILSNSLSHRGNPEQHDPRSLLLHDIGLSSQPSTMTAIVEWFMFCGGALLDTC